MVFFGVLSLGGQKDYTMNDLVKFAFRTFMVGIFWIFILSITYEERTIFSYANEIFVQNDFVLMMDEELADLWDKVYSTAKITFSELSDPVEKG